MSPSGSCIYGDDLVSKNDFSGTLTLPSTLMTCSAAIKYVVSINRDPVFFCKSAGFTFASSCCKTCSSK